MLRVVSSHAAEIHRMKTIPSGEASSVEVCIDALDETIMQLAHHSARALAAALAVHLQGAIGVLHERNECSADEVRQWLEEIVRGAFGDEC
jgi:predicted nucleic acid-binding protein